MGYKKEEYIEFIEWVNKKYPQYPESQCRKDFSQRQGIYLIYLSEKLNS